MSHIWITTVNEVIYNKVPPFFIVRLLSPQLETHLMYRIQIEFCGDRNKSRDIQTYPSAALTAEQENLLQSHSCF